MGQRFLIDTSATSKYLDNLYPEEILIWLDRKMQNTPLISFVTKMELLSYNPPFITERIRQYKADVQVFIRQAYLYGIDDAIIDEGIRIRKTVKIKLPDAIIAATAIIHNLVLVSDNDKDFEKAIPLGLQYLNPANGIPPDFLTL